MTLFHIYQVYIWFMIFFFYTDFLGFFPLLS